MQEINFENMFPYNENISFEHFFRRCCRHWRWFSLLKRMLPIRIGDRENNDVTYRYGEFFKQQRIKQTLKTLSLCLCGKGTLGDYWRICRIVSVFLINTLPKLQFLTRPSIYTVNPLQYMTSPYKMFYFGTLSYIVEILICSEYHRLFIFPIEFYLKNIRRTRTSGVERIASWP